MPTITTNLPRTIIKVSLQGLRLPLTALEIVTNKSDAPDWPPAVAYDSFEAELKKVLGSLTRDDDLVREGVLQRAKVHELAEAERLQAQAEQGRREADAKLEQRKDSAERAQASIEQQAREREQQLSREKADKERKLSDEVTERKHEAAESAQLREKLVTAKEREAERTRIEEEAAALDRRSEALNASKKAMGLDDALEAKKAQRKAI
jgi:hypothetical protein